MTGDEKERLLRQLSALGALPISVSRAALQEVYDRATAEDWSEDRLCAELRVMLHVRYVPSIDETDKPAA